MAELQRITTEYNEIEDRIRISGEQEGDQAVIIWLNQRLMLRFLPPLFLWLEKQSGDSMPVEIVQSFAQEVAAANLKAEPPVQRNSKSEEWLVVAVDLTPVPEYMSIRFRSADGKEEQLTLSSLQLRQWLQILFVLWGRAEWPPALWPNWLSAKPEQAKQVEAKRLH